MHGESPINRRESRKIWVGTVPLAAMHLSLCRAHQQRHQYVAATVAQINRPEAAGVDIVRISVPDMDAAEPSAR
jgi:(E)-4-hydroxy-3-methylbut-2-enyl-diphosphate synthase